MSESICLTAYRVGFASGCKNEPEPSPSVAPLVARESVRKGWLNGRIEYLEISHNHLGGLVSYLLRNYDDEQWDDSTREALEDANAHLGWEPIEWSNEDDEDDEE